MFFSKHTSCILEGKCEQLGYGVWFPCVQDRIMMLFPHERNSTLEPKSSRWFSFNLLMFVCFFFFLSLRALKDKWIWRIMSSVSLFFGLVAKCCGVFAVDTSVDEVWHWGRSVSRVIYGGLDVWPPPPPQSNLLSDDTEESVWYSRLLMVLKKTSHQSSNIALSAGGGPSRDTWIDEFDFF